jgi:hypothetical protein
MFMFAIRVELKFRWTLITVLGAVVAVATCKRMANVTRIVITTKDGSARNKLLKAQNQAVEAGNSRQQPMA